MDCLGNSTAITLAYQSLKVKEEAGDDSVAQQAILPGDCSGQSQGVNDW